MVYVCVCVSMWEGNGNRFLKDKDRERWSQPQKQLGKSCMNRCSFPQRLGSGRGGGVLFFFGTFSVGIYAKSMSVICT